ncbi:MAG TPA: hypothetical protein VGR84_14850 [Candidatus Acidoferrales bacterium]|nr:hypothetical protein [Candidatus Acidoferrales bacterium]
MDYQKSLRSIRGLIGIFAFLCLQMLAFPHSAPAETFAGLAPAVRAIGTRYNVHIGLEYASGYEDSPVTLNLSARKAEIVLNQLVAQNPQYAWSTMDGVFDVRPVSQSDSVLDIEVARFLLARASREQASKAIGEIPVVKAWLASHNVVRRELQAGALQRDSKVRISLTLTDVTLRTILNELIVKFGSVDWVVVRYGDEGRFLGIYF